MTWKIFSAGTYHKAKSPEDGLNYCAKENLGNEVQFVRQTYMDKKRAKEFGELAESLDVPLTIHGSYYLNLANPEKVEVSKKRVLSACDRGEKMNAKCVVIHPGYYQGDKEGAYKRIEKALEEMVKKTSCPIGLEVMGKVKSFGTIEEVVALSEIDGVVPVIDFAHWYARNQGHIDYKEVLNSFKKFKNLHSHFSCIHYGPSGERNHLPLDRKEPNFEPLAKEILKRELDISITCECPSPFEEAVKMRKILEKY